LWGPDKQPFSKEQEHWFYGTEKMVYAVVEIAGGSFSNDSTSAMLGDIRRES
jgi:hypothetical protein